jgi:hypothetical protein
MSTGASYGPVQYGPHLNTSSHANYTSINMTEASSQTEDQPTWGLNAGSLAGMNLNITSYYEEYNAYILSMAEKNVIEFQVLKFIYDLWLHEQMDVTHNNGTSSSSHQLNATHLQNKFKKCYLPALGGLASSGSGPVMAGG